MKKIIALAAIAFGITLAFVLGYKLSADALAILFGVILGVLATIPLGLILIWFISRQQAQLFAALQRQTSLNQAYPPVVVVSPGPGASLPQSPARPPLGGERRFNVIGVGEGDEEMSEVLPGRSWRE
jgi:hypothetical protein